MRPPLTAKAKKKGAASKKGLPLDPIRKRLKQLLPGREERKRGLNLNCPATENSSS